MANTTENESGEINSALLPVQSLKDNQSKQRIEELHVQEKDISLESLIQV